MELKYASADDYRQVLYALMPPGPAWSEKDELLDGLAVEFSRCHNRIVDLLREADPRTTSELLAEWEADAGLPDPCDALFGVENNESLRRRVLCAKLLSTGGQSATYYERIAREMGYDVEVRGYREHTVEDVVDYPINGSAWSFAFRISGKEETITMMAVDDGVDNRIRWWGNRLLECKINRMKQSHTIPVFIYG